MQMARLPMRRMKIPVSLEKHQTSRLIYIGGMTWSEISFR
jgi:hypothetical protein